MNWYAINTKPGREQAVRDLLSSQGGLEVYCPLIRASRFLRGQYKNIIEPLFSCYMFARFSPETHLWMVKYTRGVRKVVGLPGSPWEVADDLLDHLRSQEKDGVISARCSEPLNPGDRVRIADGPFMDLDAVFNGYLNGMERAILLLKTMGGQAHVIVDRVSLIRS